MLSDWPSPMGVSIRTGAAEQIRLAKEQEEMEIDFQSSSAEMREAARVKE